MLHLHAILGPKEGRQSVVRRWHDLDLPSNGHRLRAERKIANDACAIVGKTTATAAASEFGLQDAVAEQLSSLHYHLNRVIGSVRVTVDMAKKVVIVGAGFSGLAAART